MQPIFYGTVSTHIHTNTTAHFYPEKSRKIGISGSNLQVVVKGMFNSDRRGKQSSSDFFHSTGLELVLVKPQTPTGQTGAVFPLACVALSWFLLLGHLICHQRCTVDTYRHPNHLRCLIRGLECAWCFIFFVHYDIQCLLLQ